VFAEGDHTVTATATDAAGNTSVQSADFDLEVDITVPLTSVPDLEATSDSGISNTDNLSNDFSPEVSGTTEPNAIVEVFVDGASLGGATADSSGDWSFTIQTDWGPGVYQITTKVTDVAGNEGAESDALEYTLDIAVADFTTSPVDNETGVLPNANLVMTFEEVVNKGRGDITINQVSDDTVIETISVTGSNVVVSGTTVTIDPVDLILPPDTEFYINIDAGVFTDNAGNDFAGISNNTDWSFTIIAASVVSNVVVPSNGNYKIGDNLDFTVNMLLPITVSGTTSLPITIGDQTVNASLVGTATNTSALLFRYTVLEGQLDTDGIAIGSAMNLNGGTMQDEFGVNAILTLNNVAPTAAVLVDAIRPTPTLSTSVTTVVNGNFNVTFTFDETVLDFVLADITVENGTASNLIETTSGQGWSADINPTIAGNVIVSLASAVATDQSGNANIASNSITRQYNNNPTDIGLSTTNVNENNALDAIIASLSTTDVDAADTHLYSLVTGTGDTDNGSFIINGSSLRANNVSFNFEGGKTSYSVRVKSDDGVAGGVIEKAFTITVNNVNEAPFNLSLTNNNILESDLAQDVGSLMSLDPDNGDTFTYSLVTGTGSTNNTEFTIDGTTLKTAGLINFELGATRSIRARVTDADGLTFDQQFTINIGEVVIEPIRNYTNNAPGAEVKNVFSPNGDGINETWVIDDIKDNPINEVKVYAQGGKLIYSKVNYTNDWGGTFNNNPVPDGTYYYEINIYNGEKIIKGFLTIIRNR
jgi:gliding motility-associated-like protein